MRFGLSVVLLSLFLSSTSLMAAEVFLTVAEASLPEATDEPQPSVVYVRFGPESTQTLAEFTAAHIGEMAEIYVEDQLVFAARIREVITNGSLALFVGEESERITTAEGLLEQFEAGVPIKVVALSAVE